MKRFLTLAVIFVVGLMTCPTAAQDQKAAGQEAEVLERAIRQKYASKQEDGIDFTVYKLENGDFVPINPANHTFKKGDEFRVKFQSNFDGYIYLVNIAPNGDKAVFYPDIEFKHNGHTVRAGQTYELPAEVFVIEEDQRGIEVIQVVMSPRPVPFLEDAIRNAKGALGRTGASAASELEALAAKPAGVAVENPTKVIPDQEAVLTRNIRLAPPREKDKGKEGAVVTVSEKLKPNEVAVFEVRLRRI